MSSKIKIYLADLVHNYKQGTYVVPLNIASIAAYLKSTPGINVDIRLFKYPVDLMNAIDRDAPDILALSNYYWNNDLNRRIGSYAVKYHPNMIIAMGGPSIRTDDDGIRKFLERNSYVDAYTMFEGEAPFSNLVNRVISAGKCFRDGETIEGCAYLSGEKLIYGRSDPIKDLSVIPSPYLTGLMDEFLSGGLLPLFESNRGCPFSCTYCTWGVSSLGKVRVFPDSRIFSELEFVSKNFPDLPVWIFADANFGMFDRDLKIAQTIMDIKKNSPGLKRVVLWQTKNASEKNLKIANMMGALEDYLIAAQTFDPEVQRHIKRNNIRHDDAASIVERLRQSGVRTSTDILCGLSAETKESHLNTLRTCFEIGFDSIDCANVIMLPGSELETDKSRRDYGLRTKIRLKQGSYGEYNGIKALEHEEIILASDSITMDEMMEIRLIHWLIWYGWNAGFLKHVMEFVYKRYNINPVDLIIDVIKSRDEFLQKFFGNFIDDARSEWFESEESLRQHYEKAENWQRLLHEHFSKMNFKYTALLMLDRELSAKFIDSFYNVALKLAPSAALKESVPVIKNMTISPDLIFAGKVADKTGYSVTEECLSILKGDEVSGSRPEMRMEKTEIVLHANPADMETLRGMLIKYDFAGDKAVAVEKTLEMFVDKFNYEIKIQKI